MAPQADWVRVRPGEPDSRKALQRKGLYAIWLISGRTRSEALGTVCEWSAKDQFAPASGAWMNNAGRARQRSARRSDQRRTKDQSAPTNTASTCDSGRLGVRVRPPWKPPFRKFRFHSCDSISGKRTIAPKFATSQVINPSKFELIVANVIASILGLTGRRQKDMNRLEHWLELAGSIAVFLGLDCLRWNFGNPQT